MSAGVVISARVKVRLLSVKGFMALLKVTATAVLMGTEVPVGMAEITVGGVVSIESAGVKDPRIGSRRVVAVQVCNPGGNRGNIGAADRESGGRRRKDCREAAVAHRSGNRRKPCLYHKGGGINR